MTRFWNNLHLVLIQSKVYKTNKMKNQKYHTVGTIPKSNIKMVGRGKDRYSNSQIYDRSISVHLN